MSPYSYQQLVNNGFSYRDGYFLNKSTVCEEEEESYMITSSYSVFVESWDKDMIDPANIYSSACYQCQNPIRIKELYGTNNIIARVQFCSYQCFEMFKEKQFNEHLKTVKDFQRH